MYTIMTSGKSKPELKKRGGGGGKGRKEKGRDSLFVITILLRANRFRCVQFSARKKKKKKKKKERKNTALIPFCHGLRKEVRLGREEGRKRKKRKTPSRNCLIIQSLVGCG